MLDTLKEKLNKACVCDIIYIYLHKPNNYNMNKEDKLKAELTELANLAIEQSLEIYYLEMKVIALEQTLNRLNNK